MEEILYFPPQTNPSGNWIRNAAGYLYPAVVTDVVGMGDGAVGAPSYSFFNDLDTGMYRVGNNQLGFAAQGAQVAGIYNDAVADQILLVDRDCTNPAYSFLLDRDTGMYRGGNDQVLMAAGAAIVCGFYNDATANQVVNTDGSDANPSYSFLNERDTGIFRVGANELGFAANAGHVASIYGNLATERQIRLVDGVVTRPAYSFLNDTNLGFYRVGVDTIGVALANALDFQFSPNTFTGFAGSSMVMDTMTIAAGSITDSSGAISFGDEALSTTSSITGNSFITAQNIGIAADTDLIQLTGANAMTLNGTLTIADGGSLNLQEDITFLGATTENQIKMPDNLPNALSFQEAANIYQTFVTDNTVANQGIHFLKNIAIGDTAMNTLADRLLLLQKATAAAGELRCDIFNSTNTGSAVILAGEASSNSYIYLKGSCSARAGTTVGISNAGLVEFGTGSAATAMLVNMAGAAPIYFATNTNIRMRILGDGRVGLATDPSGAYSTADDFTIGTTSGHRGMTIFSGNTSEGNIMFADGTSGAAQYAGLIGYNHNTNALAFYVNGAQLALTLDSDKIVRVNNSIKIKERASAPGDTAAYGQLWVKTATPCELWFTDDAGTDTQIV